MLAEAFPKMALTDLHGPDPARFARILCDTGLPRDALARLPALHREAGRELHLSHFLARSPRFCVALMLAGMVTLIWTFQDGSRLAADFIWATAILIGIAAMTRTTIQGFARSPRLAPLQHTAAELRLLLLYTGLAWGAGAFLAMPDLPSPALVFAFAIGPTLACASILDDPKGAIAFGAPVILLTAGAALLGTWPHGGWVSGTVLAAGAATVSFSMLQRAIRNRRHSFANLLLF
jgi:hypothetical protein